MRKKLPEWLSSEWFIQCAVFTAAWFLLMPFYRWQIDADGISYISIAARYAAGDFSGAVNGYWGPLLSWLIVPFIKLGANPLIACKIIGLLTGIASLFLVRKLLTLLEVPAAYARTAVYVFMPVALSYFMVVISPDLLVAVLLGFYCCLSVKDDFLSGVRGPALSGALAALGYLAKSFAMPFFLAHFTALALWRGFGKKEHVLRGYIAGMVAFAVIAVPWSGVLSAKYGRLTLNTTGAYNMAVVGPTYIGHPINFEGFFEPRDSAALSVWEEPSLIPVRVWSPLASAELFRHQVHLLVKNSFELLTAYESISAFTPALLAFMLLLFIGYLRGEDKRGIFAVLLFSVALYSAGYLPIVIRARYFYLCYIILFAVGWKLITLGDAWWRDGWKTKTACALFALSFLITPANNLIGNLNSGRAILDAARHIGAQYQLAGKRVASNTRWMDTLYLAYYLRFSYLGEMRKGITQPELNAELDRFHADYFIAWYENPLVPAGWTEITDGRFGFLTIYARQ